MNLSSFSSARTCWRCQARVLGSRPSKKLAGSGLPQALRHSSSEHTDNQARGQHDARHIFPLSKLRRMRGKTLREVSTELDLESLGEPAKVVILREELDAKPKSLDRPLAGEENEEKGSVTAAQILESAYAERGLLAELEVNANIAGMRPVVKDDVLPTDQFEKLENRISLGFTRWQLDRYAQTMKARHESQLPSPHEPLSDAAPFHQSSWTHGVTPFDGSIPGREKPGPMSTKKKIISKIMREYWNLLTVQESQESGELDVVMLPQILSLLLSQNRGSLRSLAVNRGVKVDVSRQRRLVRITAAKYTAEAAAQELREIVSNRHSRELDLRPLFALAAKDVTLSQGLGGDLLRSIEETTGTVLEQVDKDKLVVHCLGPDTSSCDDAVRLLLSSMPVTAHTKRQLLNDRDSVNGLVQVVPHGQSKGLVLHEKDKSWCRFWGLGSGDISIPQPKSASQQFTSRVAVEEVVQSHVDLLQRGVGKAIQEVRPDERPSSSVFQKIPSPVFPRWDTEAKLSTFATLGHVLHEVPQGVSSGSPSNAEPLPQATRTFSYTAPNIMNSISEPPGRKKTPSQHLMIRLRPSPWSPLGVDLISNAPPINIAISLHHETRKPSIQTVQAVVAEASSDIMLPYSSTDLRITTLSTLRLDQPHRDSQISDFIARSYLDITGQAKLRTPETVKIFLPRRCFASHTGPIAVDKETQIFEDLVEVEYYFTGLDYRQSIPCSISGWRARYANIEGGRTGGGRRGELRMVMDRLGAIEEHDDKRDGEEEEGKEDSALAEETTVSKRDDEADETDPTTGEPATPHGNKAIVGQERELGDFVSDALNFVDHISNKRSSEADAPLTMPLKPSSTDGNDDWDDVS